MKERVRLTKKYFKFGKKESDLFQITALSNECTKTILEAKKKYIRQWSQKLSDPSTEPKAYWRIINRFVNNKKITMIPPILKKPISSINFLLLSAPLWKILILYLLLA